MDHARKLWRAENGAEAVMQDLRRYGAGAPLESCPSLEKLFTAQGEAERLMASLSQHYCAAIRANTIGHPPFRTGSDGKASSILLGKAGRAQLMLQSREPGTYGGANVGFSDATRYEAVLAGDAAAAIVRAIPSAEGPLRFDEEQFTLRGGERFALDLSTEAFAVSRVRRRLVILRLMRCAAEPEPSREYSRQTGELFYRSAGKLSTSRQEAIIALLGRMERTDAVPQIARVALAESDASLRWQALRECLALDSETGFCTLARIARDAQDPLSPAAGALRAQLLEAHPQLAQVEASQCPA